ncbi:hypothetical protein TOPH_07763 [Tolypocladium ophioglossoides CBS 100239]|uniref:Uncharacterized protein n=1 Tax=Tolypocladium ophioglossoides (strain CBS 100239) TaxID=1163406 RepID=A0A0L0N0L0_TOLOC|nr:hypothetical protein TOPH_07763 [Tolypocladium ophioglossoides CBS 100239]
MAGGHADWAPCDAHGSNTCVRPQPQPHAANTRPPSPSMTQTPRPNAADWQTTAPASPRPRRRQAIGPHAPQREPAPRPTPPGAGRLETCVFSCRWACLSLPAPGCFRVRARRRGGAGWRVGRAAVTS